MGQLNFWELHYLWYILGFVFLPRLTLIIIFSNYVTPGFEWKNLFVGLTIWWTYPSLGLGFWSKLLFMIFYGWFPRLLIGIIGYLYLSPDNHLAMLIFCVVGILIDILVKVFRELPFKLVRESQPA